MSERRDTLLSLEVTETDLEGFSDPVTGLIYRSSTGLDEDTLMGEVEKIVSKYDNHKGYLPVLKTTLQEEIPTLRITAEEIVQYEYFSSCSLCYLTFQITQFRGNDVST